MLTKYWIIEWKRISQAKWPKSSVKSFDSKKNNFCPLLEGKGILTCAIQASQLRVPCEKILINSQPFGIHNGPVDTITLTLSSWSRIHVENVNVIICSKTCKSAAITIFDIHWLAPPWLPLLPYITIKPYVRSIPPPNVVQPNSKGKRIILEFQNWVKCLTNIFFVNFIHEILYWVKP